MDNKEFDKLDAASKIIETLKTILYIFSIVVILALVITGIVLAVEGSIAYGLMLLFCGIIGGGVDLFCIYCMFVFLTAFVEMMYDVKQIRLRDKSIAVKIDKDDSEMKNEDEMTTVFLLLNIKHNAYFSRVEKDKNVEIIRCNKNILSANTFKSEEEARKFAQEKNFKLGEDWKIVVKRLMVSND